MNLVVLQLFYKSAQLQGWRRFRYGKYCSCDSSNRGKGGKTGGQGENHSARVGLKCLVGGIRRLLRRGGHADLMGAGASVYLAVVL